MKSSSIFDKEEEAETTAVDHDASKKEPLVPIPSHSFIDVETDYEYSADTNRITVRNLGEIVVDSQIEMPPEFPVNDYLNISFH